MYSKHHAKAYLRQEDCKWMHERAVPVAALKSLVDWVIFKMSLRNQAWLEAHFDCIVESTDS